VREDGRENFGELRTFSVPCVAASLIVRCVLDHQNEGFVGRIDNTSKTQAQPVAVIDTIY